MNLNDLHYWKLNQQGNIFITRFPRPQLEARVDPDNLEDMKAFYYHEAFVLPSQWKSFEVMKTKLDVYVLAEKKGRKEL